MRPRFEVVILNDYASVTGGSSAVAIASALGLAARDVPVTLFTCVGPIAPELRNVRNLEVVCLDQAELAKNSNRVGAFFSGLRNSEAVRALRELLARKNPTRTIVHAHTWTKALSPFALEAAASLGFPLVLTLHDFFIACPNGGFFVYPENKICTRTPLSVECWGCHCDRRNQAQKFWRNVRTMLQNRVLRVPEKVACFVGVSEFSAGILRPHLPSQTPFHIVRNPIDAVSAPPARVAENRNFVFVGRFEAEKGVELFAEAVQLAGVRATFIGDGALAPRVRTLCPNARFTGWLNAEQVRQELRAARALVFPPHWYETLGLVVVEAAASGVPAIVSDRCAATDYIRDGENGLHFAQGDAHSLARQMMMLARSDLTTAQLGQAAYDWYWAEPWTRERHVDALWKIYHELAGSPAPAREKKGIIYESAGGVGARS